jgi:hypothetical protein
MTAQWLYTPKGEAPYYQEGDCVYSRDGEPRFSVTAGWWHDIETGKARYNVADCWVYSLNGEPAYYFG